MKQFCMNAFNLNHFKITATIFSLIFLISNANLHAQIISQNFDGISVGSLPTGWTAIPYSTNPAQTDNNSAPATGNGWKVINPSSAGLTVLSSPNAIVCGASLDQKSSDWFFTKAVQLQAGSFYNLQVSATWTNPFNLPGAPAVEIGYCKDVNGNGIPEPLGADASGYVDWSGLGSGSNSWSNYNVSFTVPSTGNYFIFMLSLVVGPIITDTGPNYLALDNFSVVKGSGLSLTSPTGGEVWNSGSTHPITWISSDVTNIKIEYSLDWGLTWTTITASAPASSGSYTWKLPTVSETKNVCLLKITDVSNSSVTSSSNVFTIQLKEPSSIAIYSPNGGENWAPGTQQWIGFTGTYLTTVNLEYSTNNGVTWIKIADNQPADAGGYAWTIPNTPSAQCKVRVTDADDPTVTDVSDAAFTISGTITKSITVVSPNGGEVWAPNSLHDIKWNSALVTNVKLEYSSNNGSNWNTIAASVFASQSSYSWTTPNISSTTCLIRISDSGSPLLYDVSNAVFTIKLIKTVQVTSPNGGESWNVGSTQTISWSTQGVASVKLEYSTNNGNTWNTIATSSATSFSWVVPDAVSSNCLVRASDASDAAVNDASDAVFSIVKIASVTVLSPNGGEKLVAGTTTKILWNSTNIDSVKIEVKFDSSYYYIPLATVSASSGNYDWLIDYFSNLHQYCIIRISDAANAGINDVSDGYFSIVDSLTLLTPNGGEIWAGGSTHQIKWNNFPDFYISLDYSTNNGTTWTRIARDILASSKLYNWIVPNAPSTQCLVRIKNTYDSLNVFDVSDAQFTIGASPIPSLKLISPNGGEKLTPGGSFSITWQSANVDSISIQQSLNNGFSWSTLKSSYPAAGGSFTWTLSSLEYYTQLYSQCYIKITDRKNSAVKDLSDNVFSIGPWITLLSPNGGEKWMANTVDTIKWKSGGLSSVNIDVSTDNGATWTAITIGTKADAESYLWGVTNTVSATCLIRISDYSKRAQSAISGSVFSIVPLVKKITVISPNGGEKLIQGTENYFRWSSSNVRYVRLEYSTNAGTTWILKKSNWYADSTKYLWVPTMLDTSNSCLVKISDANDLTTYDVSDALFSIVPALPKKLTLLTPSGGEYLAKGSNLLISWQAEAVETIKLEYSTNGGTAWMTISNGIQANKGSYLWKTPAVPSNNYLVRISDSSNAAISAVSANPFTIFELLLTAPNGGENYLGRDIAKITWQSQFVAKIKIEYSLDGGISWNTAADSVDGALHTYNWSVPNLTTSSALVKITNRALLNFITISANPFSITKQLNPNLILNGDFTGGMLHWNTYIDASAAAILATSGGQFAASITKGGTQSWHIQLLQPNIKLEKGKTYDLTFSASGNSARTIQAGVSQDGGTYQAYYYKQISLTSAFLPYSSTFTMTYTTDDKARFYIDLGMSNIGVKFDNIELREHDSEKLISLLQPAKEDTLQANNNYIIAWTGQNIGQLNLSYRLWNTEVWTSIAKNISGGQNSFTWKVPDVSFDSCQIKLEDGSDSKVFAVSGKFYIKKVTGVEITESLKPEKFCLFQNYPNPFNPSTIIAYRVAATSFVALRVFDMLGNEVATLINEEQQPGYYEVVFYTQMISDKLHLSSGIYFYQLRASDFVQTNKMVLAK